MKSFSQKIGIKSTPKKIQVNSMDNDLRNSLWNILTLYYWDKVKSVYIHRNIAIKTLLYHLWMDYFKKPVDDLNNRWSFTHKEIRQYFFNCEWYEVYDFIEFVVNNYPDYESTHNIMCMNACNYILERELSAYRFVDGKIVPISSKEEISEIEEALKISGPYKSVSIHLSTALNYYADRNSPDFRNSIKESISAVESICKLIAKDENATLGSALKKIKKKLNLHPALEEAFKKLYGYTSNAEGIRHALLNKDSLDREDAKFMLVICSAFVNYLFDKASKARIEI